MRFIAVAVAALAACLAAAPITAEDASTGQLELELVPPYIIVLVTCTDPTQPLGYSQYEVEIVAGGIDEPMTWTKPGPGNRRTLVNAWRLRLGNGETVVTTQPCSYRL